MQLLDEIIGLLTSEQGGLSAALIKGQVLAHKLGDQSLRTWVLSELNGYADSDSVPAYRQFRGQLMGTASNAAFRHSNTDLPTDLIPEELRDEFLTIKVCEGVSAIQSLVGQPTGRQIPSEICALLSSRLAGGVQIQSAYLRMPAGGYEEILSNVRTRYLDLVLALSEKLPAEPAGEEIKAVAKGLDVRKYITNATFGDNATINFGDGNSFSHTNTVSKGDFGSLAKELESHKVPAADIAELETAIQLDTGSAELAKGSLGPKVRAWIGGMVAKAGTAAWDFSMQAGAGVLSGAVLKYYGLG